MTALFLCFMCQFYAKIILIKLCCYHYFANVAITHLVPSDELMSSGSHFLATDDSCCHILLSIICTVIQTGS